jgi:putative ABC transport system permease protein|tara:strand:- start:1291 stop:1887 length:597 start_codon:yes stop_codon:yes gene_type:complete
VFDPDLSEVPEETRRTFSLQVLISTDEGAINSVTGFLRQRWASFDLEHPFEFTILEESLNDLYGAERRLMQLIGLFAAICILISCLGLYGLSSFNTAQRTKEIGVRKVLGASSTNIILLLFKKVLSLVVVASLIASLVSFWVVSEWLQNFYYRIDVVGTNLLLFLIAAILAVTIAFVTMALQSFRTAQSNPVNALRYE